MLENLQLNQTDSKYSLMFYSENLKSVLSENCLSNRDVESKTSCIFFYFNQADSSFLSTQIYLL